MNLNLYLDFIFLMSCVGIACWDFLFYKIPNKAILGVLVLALIHLLLNTNGDMHYLMWTFLAAFVALAISYGLYSFKLLGAGDGKYIAVAILFIPLKSAFTFLIIMSLAGGVLGLFYKLYHAHISALKRYIGAQLPERFEVVEETGKTVPYGVAITVGIIGAYILGS